jgi:hypothetical protein
MPTIPTCFNPTAAELACYVTIRGPYFYAKTLFASLIAATIGVVLLPLLVTGTSSYGAASEVCYDRSVLLRTAWFADPESPYYDPEWDVDADDSALDYLFPVHLFNAISTLVSLFGFGVWLFFSPHKSERESDMAKDLDRTCMTPACTLIRDFFFRFFCNTLSSMFCNLVGSYFAVQWLANLLVTATSLGGNCVALETTYTVVTLVSLLVSHGLSIIGTNILCHRYLCEKARVMISMYASSTLPRLPLLPCHPPIDPPLLSAPIHAMLHVLPHCSLTRNNTNDPSVKWLEKLGASFVWEARSLYFVAVAAPLFFVYPPAAIAVTGLAALVVIVMVRARFCSALRVVTVLVLILTNRCRLERAVASWDGTRFYTLFFSHLLSPLPRRTPHFPQ